MKPRHTDLPGDCRAIGDVLARVGDKWSVLVVTRLGDGAMRFNELKRSIGGISQRMLTLTLRGLERDGLVTRTVLPTVPPRVDYALTPLGRDLLQPVSALGAWAIRNQAKIARAREKFDGQCQERGKPPLRRTARQGGREMRLDNQPA
jgi:DNA-binding HxlR family transcriptional regulator